MVMGLLGMSYFSSPVIAEANPIEIIPGERCYGNYQGLGSSDDDGDDGDALEADATVLEISMHPTHRQTRNTPTRYRDGAGAPNEGSSLPMQDDESSIPVPPPSPPSLPPPGIVMVEVWGCKIPKRQLGMLAAAFCGIWGGSIMAPMKFSKGTTKGTHYLLSFAIGASIVNITLWVLRFSYTAVRCRSLTKAYDGLPSFHLRVMWLAGGASGLLWSIGNFFSLISVFYLGEGVGYPLVQTSILVSGLWGIFYFKEVQGAERISHWLLSSLLTIFGILFLSYQHHAQ